MSTFTPSCVLVVDDEEIDQFIASHVISQHWQDCRLLFANDGLEAIELLKENRENPPDLILLDINMPRMNGHTFLDAWYTDRDLESPAVVMLTSSNQEQDRERVADFACVKGYMVKPVSPESLSAIKLSPASISPPKTCVSR